MAAFNHVQNMYDISLKSRLLRSLIKEYIPDEKHPFRSPMDLSHVVSMVKTHRLLSESAPAGLTDQKQMENWKSSVDAWVNRLLMLASNDMPDKCWAGICLLGVTCQECGSERFLASYAVWFPKLLLHIKPPADSHLVKVASCASISDLFARLGGFANAKKDGTIHAAKLIQPVLKLLNEDSSDAVWEGAVSLLCTIITYFPSSTHQHYDSVEAAIVSKFMSGKCSGDILKKLGHCLALLPKSRGDEDSWSLMMQKVLLSINVHLSDAFQGLEYETKKSEVMRILVPPGKDPPLPLGGQTMLGENSIRASKRPERLLMSSVSTLMLCCCKMLTSHYPVQVTIPVRSLLVLAGRVLMVDGSLSQALFPFMTTMQQEFICSELPVLHLYSLELLVAIVKGVRSQLLPHAADIVRLLTEYFKRCALPELRIKVYSIFRTLLMSMGVGITLFLTQDLINNAFTDLDESGGTSSSGHSTVSNKAFMQPSQKKRKHKSNTSPIQEQPDGVNLELELELELPKSETPKSVKIAALEALEALLTVGGALRSESWRSNIDRLLIIVASNACKGGWALEECSATWADFQLAALRALLASLVSPTRVRPPYLAQGLELFRRGMVQETGTKVAEFCTHAVLALEVLIHPRALPMMDFECGGTNIFDKVNSRFPEIIYSSGQKQNTPFSSGTLGKRPYDADSDDDLYKEWLETGEEIRFPVTEPVKKMNNTEEPSETDRVPLEKKLISTGVSSDTKIPEESEKNGKNRDEIMVDSEKFQEPISHGGFEGNKFGKVVIDRELLEPMDSEMAPGKDVLAEARGDELNKTGEETSATISNSERGKEFLHDSDNDSSTNSFPDIVDEDSDSD